MTAKELANQILGRGYKTMTARQAEWFSNLASQDPSIQFDLRNSSYSYTWRDGDKVIFVDVLRHGGYGAKISTCQA